MCYFLGDILNSLFELSNSSNDYTTIVRNTLWHMERTQKFVE